MSHNSSQSQQESRLRWFSVAKIGGMLVLTCCCGGCWEEVHFEPQEGAEVVEATPAEGLLVPVEVEEVELGRVAREEVVSPPAEAGSPGGDGEGREGLEVWRMASRWSMAAALQAKSGGADRYGERLELAMLGARELGVELPELPKFEDGAKRLPASLSYLLEDAGPLLVEDLREKYGAERAALAELAMKSNVLLLIYTPKSTRVEPIINAIRTAAEASRLPESVWRELVDLLEKRAEFKQVKTAVFQLHQQVVNTLEAESDS